VEFYDFNDMDLPTMNRSWNMFDQNSFSRLPSFSADLVDCGDKYCVHADIPGMQKENINITLQGHDLKIEGERKGFNMQNTETYRTRERYYGKFIRTFRLPEDAIPDPSRYAATYKDGVLSMEIPKMEDQTKKHQVHKISLQ